MKTTSNKITRAEGTLAAVTGGRNAWTSEVLRAAAESCLRGEPAHEFQGRPEDSAEFADFERAWKRVQSR
jgi:hypothetical protein